LAEPITRRQMTAGALASFAVSRVLPLLSFWVFGLLKPTVLNVYAQENFRLHCQSLDGNAIVEGNRALRIDARTTPVSVAAADGGPVALLLEIPGVIRRRYFGKLAISCAGHLLQPVVSMEREVAVASIVAAELPLHATPIPALCAQAVAVRSFLSAARQPRHSGAQFCDTTHCQFLRGTVLPGSPVERAARLTAGSALHTVSAIIPAHYSAACGGQTGSAELDNYRYSSVICESCRRDHVARRGHGLGLCQTGAISLARAGWHWEEIVGKYYPGALIGVIG